MIKKFKQTNEAKAIYINAVLAYFTKDSRWLQADDYKYYLDFYDRGIFATIHYETDLALIIDRLGIFEEEPRPFGVFKDDHDIKIFGFMEETNEEAFPYRNFYTKCIYNDFTELKTMEEIQEFSK